MPIHKSAKKRLKQSLKRREKNKAVKSEIKTWVKKVTQTAGTPNAQARLKELFSLLDKAARKNIIHTNAATRTKSRLAKLVNQKTVA